MPLGCTEFWQQQKRNFHNAIYQVWMLWGDWSNSIGGFSTKYSDLIRVCIEFYHNSRVNYKSEATWAYHEPSSRGIAHLLRGFCFSGQLHEALCVGFFCFEFKHTEISWHLHRNLSEKCYIFSIMLLVERFFQNQIVKVLNYLFPDETSWKKLAFIVFLTKGEKSELCSTN